jgi:hypothetical protein
MGVLAAGAIAAKLKLNSTVVFDKVPPGSYLTAGEPYVVENVGKTTASFRRLRDGGATTERFNSLKQGAYRVIEETK